MKSNKRFDGVRWHHKALLQPYDHFSVADENGPKHLLLDTMSRIEGASQTLVALADKDYEAGDALCLLAEELFDIKMDVCKVVTWMNDRMVDNLTRTEGEYAGN